MEENGELLSGQLSFKQGLLSGWKQSFCSVLYGVLRVYSNKAPKKLLFTFNPDSSWISAKNGADNGLFVMNVTDPGLTKFFLFEAGDLERLTQWLDALKKAGWTSAVFSDKLRYHQRSILKNKLTENTMISNPEDVTQINNIALRRTNENNKEINGMPFDDSIISDKSYYCSRSILKQRHNIPVNENTSNNSEDITSDITESNLPLKHAEESNKESSHDTVFDDSIESSGTTRSLELNRIYKKPRKSDSMDSEGTADFDSVSLTSAAGSTSHHIRNNSYLESGYCSKESLATSVSTDPDTSRSVMPAFPEMDCQCEDDELEVKVWFYLFVFHVTEGSSRFIEIKVWFYLSDVHVIGGNSLFISFSCTICVLIKNSWWHHHTTTRLFVFVSLSKNAHKSGFLPISIPSYNRFSFQLMENNLCTGLKLSEVFLSDADFNCSKRCYRQLCYFKTEMNLIVENDFKELSEDVHFLNKMSNLIFIPRLTFNSQAIFLKIW